MRVLVVEDDPLLGDAIRVGFARPASRSDWVRDGAAATVALASEPFAAVVLDLGLPQPRGLELLRSALRAAAHAVPVLILTARDTVADRIAGLDAGADDYLVKPFDLGELAARLRALAPPRRRQAAPLLVGRPARARPGRAPRCSFGGRAVELSAREFALLHALRAMPAACSRRTSSPSASTAGARRSSRTPSRCTSTTCGASSHPR